ncbi:MAG TPA: glycosyltransferase, partial [Marinobacter sp.]
GNKAASLVSAVERYGRVAVGTLHGTKRSHKAFDRLDGVIGVSREIINSTSHPNARLIFNGLHSAEHTQGDQCITPAISIPTERPLLLAAGRLEPVKQFDRLIRAWAQADCDGKLVILGDGSERARLNALVRELDAGDHILLPGHEPRILPWLQAATACIISSSREGFPYIMVEALMAGCPVLSTPVSGVKEFLPQRYISTSDGVENIARLIRNTLAESGSLTDLQSESFRQARAQLSLATMVSKTEDFYRHLLASGPARR